MFLARVVGSVQASTKQEALEGVKLLVIQPVKSSGEAFGDTLVACDSTQAGPGELIYYCDGREAALAFNPSFVAVDATIVAIVDSVG
jgi:ethanolamine utilization protein EutN